MSFELTGKIIEIYNLVEVSDRFKKQEFVIERIEMSGTYEFTDTIKFQLTQERTGQINGFNKGDEVKVLFNVRGNKWEKDGKVNYFTNLDAWKIENISTAGSDAPNTPPAPEFDEIPPEETDDLPF